MEWQQRKILHICYTILGRLGCNASIDVLLKPLHSQAVPLLLYGISAVTLTNTELSSFCNAYNNIYYKIFRSFDRNTIIYCQWYCGFWPFELLYDYHRHNFLNELVVSDSLNNTIDLDIPEIVEFINIRKKYGILWNDSISKIRYKFWRYFEKILP